MQGHGVPDWNGTRLLRRRHAACRVGARTHRVGAGAAPVDHMLYNRSELHRLKTVLLSRRERLLDLDSLLYRAGGGYGGGGRNRGAAHQEGGLGPDARHDTRHARPVYHKLGGGTLGGVNVAS